MSTHILWSHFQDLTCLSITLVKSKVSSVLVFAPHPLLMSGCFCAIMHASFCCPPTNGLIIQQGPFFKHFLLPNLPFMMNTHDCKKLDSYQADAFLIKIVYAFSLFFPVFGQILNYFFKFALSKFHNSEFKSRFLVI